MLNANQIQELKTKKFYKSTYKILFNIRYYLDMKNHFPLPSAKKSDNIAINSIKFVLCLFSLFKIKRFANFRNKNIERFLNDDVQLKSIIIDIESNKWLNVENYNFVDKIRAVRESTYALYSDEHFIIEVKEFFNNESDFSYILEETFKKLLDEYDLLIKAWTYCRNNGCLTITHVINKYNELMDNYNLFSGYMDNDRLNYIDEFNNNLSIRW